MKNNPTRGQLQTQYVATDSINKPNNEIKEI